MFTLSQGAVGFVDCIKNKDWTARLDGMLGINALGLHPISQWEKYGL
jgi:hypothetical protein